MGWENTILPTKHADLVQKAEHFDNIFLVTGSNLTPTPAVWSTA